MEFVLDAFIDALKIWPLLVIVYVVFEFMGNQRTTYLKNHRLGPVLGAIGGCIPQCGASVAVYMQLGALRLERYYPFLFQLLMRPFR